MSGATWWQSMSFVVVLFTCTGEPFVNVNMCIMRAFFSEVVAMGSKKKLDKIIPFRLWGL